MDRASIDTLLAQGGHTPDARTGALVPPLHTSTTFARDGAYELPSEFIYARYGGPTVAHVEGLLAEIEGGEAALLFGAGMAAITTVFAGLAPGDHVVAPTVMYHGAQTWLRELVESRGIELTLFDSARPEALGEAVRRGSTALVWIETATNPTWDVIDIAAASEVAHAAGALLAVDSTVSPPVTTKPLDLGADLVFHSGTKYLNGHSDVLAGVLVTRTLDERWEAFRRHRTYTGGIASPFDAWMLNRGMRTLALRFDRCSANALQIARHFEFDPRLNGVLYPGLPTHPSHEVAARQMTRGFGGLMSLLVDGDATRARQVATALRLFAPATSLGGVESLVEHRATVEGPHSTVPQNLLRLSVGIEDAEDLIADLDRALG